MYLECGEGWAGLSGLGHTGREGGERQEDLKEYRVQAFPL